MIEKPYRPLGVEAHDPVTHDLQGDVAETRRLRARDAVVDRRQGEQKPVLTGVLARPCQAAKFRPPR